MRIACLQFAPQLGDVGQNINRVHAILNQASPKHLDLLVLPELAFSGYNFKSLKDITPFLELTTAGISSVWARTTALKYGCVVAVGYPEKVDITASWPCSPEYYNSLIAVDKDGETIANYRKSHLYYTDETWALEGPDGFFDGEVPGLGTVAMGICMDLNPYKFEAPWNAWEFAYHILHRQANLVVVSMAWLTREDAHSYSQTPMDPDMETLSYWVTRLEPLIRREDKGEIIVVFANRTGIEGDAIYAGTSAVLGIEAGEVKLYGILGRGEQGLLVVDTSKMPQAKLVYETNTTDSSANTTDSSESRSTESSITDPDDSVPSISEVLSGMAPISPVEPKSPHSFFSSQPAKAEDRHTLHSSIAHEEDHSQSLQSSKENSYQDLESALNGGNRCDNSTPAPESQFEWFCSPTSRNASQNASRNCEPIAQERTLLGHDLAVESEHIVDADHAQLDSRNVLGNKGAVSVNPVLLGGDEQEKEVHGLMPYRELGARAMRPKSMGW